jgi:hypothetical protein
MTDLAPTYYSNEGSEADEQRGSEEPGTHETNDVLTEHAQGAGVWGNPASPDDMQQPAHLPHEGFDYSAGMFVGVPGEEADAVPGTLHPTILAKLPTDVPKSYEALHESTHRRFDSPFTVAINQLAAGFSLLAPPQMGLHFIKVLACYVTLDAAGTLRFVQGSSDGTNVAAISGNLALGGANNGLVQLSPADIATPWFFTSPDQALGIFTVTGKAQGFVTCCYSPYEA